MSAIPSELAFGRGPSSSGGGRTRLSTPALAYLVVIVLAAGAAAIPVMGRLQHEQQTVRLWLTFILLATATALAQVLLVKTPRNQSYHATMVFLLPSVLLLPPELVVLVAIAQHIPAWLKNRTAWYIESFNICTHILATLAAWGSAQLVLQADGIRHEVRVALHRRPDGGGVREPD